MKILGKYFIPAILVILWASVFIKGLIFLDPDFGWHLKEGQLILQSGIQATDPFSYTMPSYAFIDHEWLINILMYLVYSSFGIYVLSGIFASISTLALYFLIPEKNKHFVFIPLFLAGTIVLGFSGVRTQEITWLFFALILKIIFDKNLWAKWKYFIPLIFLPWVNLHGGFAVGIAILFVFSVFTSFKNKKLNMDSIKVLFLSFLASLINPYGVRIWHEIWMQVSDNTLHLYISEWTPGVFYFDVSFCILFALSFSLIFVYRKKLSFEKIGIYSVLLLMAISSARHIPLWAIAAVFITSDGLFLFWEQVKKNRENIYRFEKIKKILMVVFFAVFLYELGYVFVVSNNLNSYPINAVNVLNKQNIKGNLFAPYDVGGYLIWKFPNHKVFIDGRMPSWRRIGNYYNESNYAFKDYLKMISDDNFFKEEIKKYNITYILFPKPRASKNSIIDEADNFLRRLVYKNIDGHILYEDLSKFGFIKIYSDKKFVIYKV